MTSNRNLYADRQATNAVLQQGAIAPIAHARPNWLGHTKGSANIDAALIAGATIDAMVMAQFRTTRRGVLDHIRHLRNEHGLVVAQNGDHCSFVQNAAA